MAKATTAAKTPATSKLGKTDTAKTAPAKTKVGAATQPAAKTPAAKKAADKPAKNGINTVVEQAKAAKPAGKTAPAKQPAAKPAAKTAAPVGRPSANADQKLKVAEPDKPRRGVTQEYVNEAIKLKTFTRQRLHDIMVGKGHESGAARTKIADCVYFQVFVAA